jgi:hypothetical protein
MMQSTAMVKPFHQIQEGAANGHHASTTSVLNTRGPKFSPNNGTLSKSKKHIFILFYDIL